MRGLIEAKVKDEIEGKYKDQKLVDVETTEAIVERLRRWTKWVGYFGGIPILLFLIVLGILGFHELRDFKRLIQSAEDAVRPKVQQALKDAQEAEQQAGQAKDKASEAARAAEKATEEANKQLASVKGLTQRINDLNRQVSDAKTQAENASEQIRSIAASTSLKVPLITSAAPGPPVVIKGVNFGADFGHVSLRVRNASTNKEVVPEMELKKDSISQWKDNEITLRLPDAVSAKISEVKEAEIEAAKRSPGGSVFGAKYEYMVQTANRSKSNWQAHVEWAVNVYESLKIGHNLRK